MLSQAMLKQTFSACKRMVSPIPCPESGGRGWSKAKPRKAIPLRVLSLGRLAGACVLGLLLCADARWARAQAGPAPRVSAAERNQDARQATAPQGPQPAEAPGAAGPSRPSAPRPNILWITCEDMDPNLGCFGDLQAVTPHLDALAARSVRYTRVFATAPACSPARSCLITGVWPGTMGTPHLRNETVAIPAHIKPYPMYLREAGYYCTNRGKQDYNYAKPPGIWDDESPQGHWRGRQPGQPFFAVFNIMTTHQGQFRAIDMSAQTKKLLAALPPAARHDPARIKLPPFYPDTPVVRRDVATHYDCISAMDRQVGELLGQLEEDGLADETIIFFYSDHGRGMPRGKRWLYDGGLHVPLMICFPPKWRHLATGPPGSINDRLVSFIDFPPTLLSLVGVKIAEHMEGVAFAGPQAGPPRAYIHAARDRVDEVIERSRAVRDARYKYIRHYLPHRPMMQFGWYSERTPTRGELRRLAAEGKLFGHEKTLLQPTKPIEELHDTAADPYELHNLADDPEYAPVLARLRSELRRWLAQSPDACLLPEGMMHARAGKHGVTVYEMARDPELYPVGRIIEAAEMVGRPEVSLDDLVERLGDEDAGVRYWAAVALAVKGPEAAPAAEALEKCLADEWPDVRIAAAEALCRLGRPDDAVQVLADALGHEDYWVRIHAAAVLHELGETARPALPAMKQAAAQEAPWPYLGWGLERTIGRLEQ